MDIGKGRRLENIFDGGKTTGKGWITINMHNADMHNAGLELSRLSRSPQIEGKIGRLQRQIYFPANILLPMQNC